MSSFPIFLISSGGARGGHGWASAQPEFIRKSELPEITHDGPGYRLFIHTNILMYIQATHFNEVNPWSKN